ncbi:site-specific integrase [Actinomadura chibensis]|uniref:Site-specific integrase n=1 Tax=Actinomadura chibensis TaxID=392828 RepID=A0A5D0NZ82_9ACTN|nr:site-specific integrase [Actinomadura chibensis]TYB49331.1 site-specific integrase [Actinomadura chibensis]
MPSTTSAVPEEPEDGKKRKSTRSRANGEGSIYPYRNGYAAYAWVTTPAGERTRKYVYGKTRDIVHDKYIKLLNEAKQRPIATRMPTVEQYLTYWLTDVIEPNREPNTYSHYELMSRLHVIPGLGKKRLDRLTVRDVQKWLNGVPGKCQCCAQGKDARRPKEHKNPRKRQRCCAIGQCCKDYPSRRTITAARNTLRAALNQARTEEIISRNVAALAKVPTARKRTRKASTWTVEEARRFLEYAREANDPLYAAWVLILVMGMRKGEVFGLRWADIDFKADELTIEWQLQRVGSRLIHKERTKTDGSTDVLPLPSVCTSALRVRERQLAEARDTAGDDWQANDLVFTTRTGRAIEPRNVNRAFESRCAAAGVRVIRVHDTRHTCGKLLAALDVHPRVAMQILRHSRISITMEIYTEVPSEDTRAALKRLGDHLRQAGGDSGEASV